MWGRGMKGGGGRVEGAGGERERAGNMQRGGGGDEVGEGGGSRKTRDNSDMHKEQRKIRYFSHLKASLTSSLPLYPSSFTV
jgi:hypothetical protein